MPPAGPPRSDLGGKCHSGNPSRAATTGHRQFTAICWKLADSSTCLCHSVINSDSSERITHLVQFDTPTLFSPGWGSLQARIWGVMDVLRAGSEVEALDGLLAAAEPEPVTFDEARYAFSIALLRDILRAGGRWQVRDSRLLVSWPNWEGSEGRTAAQAAMKQVQELRPLAPADLNRVRPLFAEDVEGETLARVLEEGEFNLVAVNNSHPSGLLYSEGFSAALRYWSMPYRGRTGRMRRFVITAQHDELLPSPVIAGLIELGDEAPFCTWRDDLLALSPASAAAWLERQPGSVRSGVADRLRDLRMCIRDVDFALSVSDAAAELIVARTGEIERLSHGRSKEAAHPDLLKARKRLSYALRLARGELYLRRSAETEGSIDPSDSNFISGVRALHDVLLPRMHMEVTVCGAVPPFSEALGGKLVVSFLSHPDIVAATTGSMGELLGWTFDLASLGRLVPSHGLVCLTTKGLYSNHAAIYNRASVPGLNGDIALRHLANTEGVTTSFLSAETARLARRVLVTSESDLNSVSMVYGSGGAKRQRAIEAAASLSGLSSKLAMAGIRRPVYGMLLVDNPAEISWLNAEPSWSVDLDQNSSEADSLALSHWRHKWLSRAQDRAFQYALIPGLTRALSSNLLAA